MYNDQNDAQLTNVIIWDNHGGSIYNYLATLMISYSDIQGCVVSGNWQASCGTNGGGNIDSDPLFVDADGADNTAGTLDDNLRLQLGSPAIDAGNNAAPGLSGITTDLKGYPRFVDGNADNNAVVDMGAYEAQLISPLYAAPASLGEGNCSSWANACTLADALAFAMSGEQVWVKAGVHYPVATTSNPRQATFTLRNGVKVYGGFAGTETALSERNWQTNLTILSGDIDQNDINTDGNYIAEKTTHIQGNNAYHVVTGGGTNNTAVLDGFVITAGQANGGSFPDNVGGGMFNQSSSPTLSNLIFSGNSAYGGGGMDNDYSNPTLTNVTFSGNSATFGGGMLNTSNSSPMLTNVTFSGNSASGGGGMYNHSSSPTLRNLIFSGNSAAFGGGMFNASNSSPMLTNVAFSGNSAGSGGGMYNDLSNPKLTNVTFSGNSATNGGGMYNFSSNPKLTNVIIWGSTSGGSIANASSSNPTISYSDVQGCVVSGNWQASCGTDGGNNIDANPLFVDAKGADNIAGTLDDNLRLGFDSPAIDKGTDSGCPTTDLDNLLRPADGDGNGIATCDMGAFEAGTMICDEDTSTYSFPHQSNVSIQVIVRENLACLYVDEMGLNHPNATPGIQTGRYWLIRALQSDKKTGAAGYTVNLTLPADFTPSGNDKVCRYTGSGTVWDCAMNSYTSNTITRDGINQLSDWAVGKSVGPTAVRLTNFRAVSAPSLIVWLLPAALAIALFYTKKWLAEP